MIPQGDDIDAIGDDTVVLPTFELTDVEDVCRKVLVLALTDELWCDVLDLAVVVELCRTVLVVSWALALPSSANAVNSQGTRIMTPAIEGGDERRKWRKGTECM